MIRQPMIVCTAHRSNGPVNKRQLIKKVLKKSIDHALLICPNFEDTIECRVAWDTVNDLTRALHNQVPDRVPQPHRDLDAELAERHYDV
jgi:hypothetical protein